MYNKGLFSDWVPKPVSLILIILFLLPLLAINGIYTGNISFMSSQLGIMSEWVVLANYLTVVGMAAAFPVLMRFKRRFKVRHSLLTVFMSLAALSVVMATTSDPYVLLVTSFFIGFFKILGLVEMILPIMMMIAPDGNRGKFYSIFYPIALSLPQAVGYLFTDIGFFTKWENTYFLMASIMILCALVVLITTHNKYFDKKIPLYRIDWLGMLLYIVILMALGYVMVFARRENYFHSESIVFGITTILVCSFIYMVRVKLIRRPYIDFSALKQYNVVHGTILLMLLGMFLAGGFIQSRLAVGVLGYTPLANNSLNLWMIPGIVLVGFIGMKWLAVKRPVKYFIAMGFFAFLAYYVLLYFMIAPEVEIQRFQVLMMIRGIGLASLYIGVWLYALDNLTMDQTLAVVAVLIVVRSMFGPGIWNTVLSYMDQSWQWQAVSDLGSNIDAVGISPRETFSIYSGVRIQAILIASQKVVAVIISLGLVALMYSLFHHYQGLTDRKLVLLRKLTRGKSIKGYRIEGNQALEKGEAEAAGAAAF